ncbi:MAG: hypothetical protein K2H35_04345 [Muribaculaceae bacterium]|nr:hypothetical protein [Muribaculaceae bacterium]
MEKNKINLRGTLNVTDWLQDIQYIPASEETEIVQVLFKNTRSAFFRNPDKLPLKKGDWVAVEASPGHDIGQVMLTGPLVRLRMKKNPATKEGEIKQIFRIATDADIEKFKEARAKEHTTMIRSRQIAADLGLNMKIGDVEYQGDGAKAIFYYIADERVDFRKLIRILADTFKIRIEMKQIGARQEAGRIGGIGPCGRPLCCSSWMSRFVSVGTGAARIQDLSMNPQKLAGQCGKLKCCINFETEAYSEAAREFPPKDAVLITQEQEYFQFKTDILARTITYSTDKKMPVNLITISVERAKEIIRINKRGEKPEQLEAEKAAPPQRQEYVELVGQDSLTRFDKKAKKKKKNKNSGGNNNAAGNNNSANIDNAGNNVGGNTADTKEISANAESRQKEQSHSRQRRDQHQQEKRQSQKDIRHSQQEKRNPRHSAQENANASARKRSSAKRQVKRPPLRNSSNPEK